MEEGARLPTTEVLGWRSRRRLCQMSLRDKNNVYLLQIGGLHPGRIRKRSQRVHGFRMGRVSIREAGSSPRIVSRMGSHVILRPVRIAISLKWLMKSD